MKSVLLFPIVLVLTSALPHPELHQQWNNFKKTHAKSYNLFEEMKRLKIFEDNLKKIEAHNALYEKQQTTYKMGITQFADLTREEFIRYLNNQKKPTVKTINRVAVSNAKEAPEEIDWREKGAVTVVKNQGQCGSAWLYSLIGTLEGQNFVTNGVLVPLSDQELIDCLPGGCNGGFIQDGYDYVSKNGISAAVDYPTGDGTCRRDDIPSAVTISGVANVESGNEEALREAVGTTGPVAVAVDASNWQFYAGGILLDPNCSDSNLNHGVVVVGYGQDGGDKYWYIKNSWGVSWGEEGYIRTARDADNNCGIATDASYPVVNKQ